MKKLAIIIPAYKPRFLQETLDSIAKQNNHEFTVYIGDDASPYPLETIVDRYKNKFDIIYHRFEQNSLTGTVPSYNPINFSFFKTDVNTVECNDFAKPFCHILHTDCFCHTRKPSLLQI